jgi:hypothetical protein
MRREGAAMTDAERLAAFVVESRYDNLSEAARYS